MESGQHGHYTNLLLADEEAASEPRASTQQEQLRASSEGGPECLNGRLLARQLGLVREDALDDLILLHPASTSHSHVAQAGLRAAAAPAGLHQGIGSSRMIPLPTIGSPLQPSTVVRQLQLQQQQQRHTAAPLVAQAVTGTPTFQMVRAPPYTTESLVTTGDQILQEYQGPAFLWAIQRGRYAHHKPFLERIWDYIQSVQLLPAAVAAAPVAGNHSNITVVQQVSSSLPAPGSAATGAEAGKLLPQHFWSVPPAISGSSRTRTAAPRQIMAEPAAPAVAGLAPPSLPAAGPTPPLLPSAAAAAGLAQPTGTSAAYNEFVARNFHSYTSATPIAIGGDRYIIPLKQTNLGPLSDQYAGWGFRMWVCAVRVSKQQPGQQHQATIPAAAAPSSAAATAATAEVGVALPTSSHMFSEQALLYDDPCADIIADMPLAGLDDLLSPHEAAQLATAAAQAEAAAAAAAVAATTGVDGGPAASPAVVAGDTVADAGSSDGAARWPYNSSHVSVGHVKYDRDRKRAPKAGKGAAAAAAAVQPGPKHKASKPRRSTPALSGAEDSTYDSYLLDLSIGWCVFAQEPQRLNSSSSARSQQQGAKRSRLSTSMDWTPAPTGAAAAAAAAIVAGDGSSPSSSLGLAGLQIATDRAPTEAGNQQGSAAAATTQQHLAGIAVRSAPAAAAAAAAIDDLTALLHQLEVKAAGWTPQRLLSWFQPASDDASAAVGILDLSEISSTVIRNELLRQDVKDKYGRNVLHTVASCKPDRFEESAAAAAAVTCRLDILLEDADSRNKLMRDENDNGATPLMVAATFGVPEVYNRLLAAADMTVVQTTTKSGWSVLHRLADSAQQAAGDREAWQRFQQCMIATVEHIVQLAIGFYNSSETVTAVCEHHQSQEQRDKLRLCLDWVTGVITLPEPTCRYYQGAQAMREADVKRKAQELLQAELVRLGVQL